MFYDLLAGRVDFRSPFNMLCNILSGGSILIALQVPSGGIGGAVSSHRALFVKLCLFSHNSNNPKDWLLINGKTPRHRAGQVFLLINN
jgi:hypothetical protein